ncbi:MAG: hypothetical protein KDA41_06930, partial [Planctomycetales bacterium]|nr:hypothetical protein [Planctomycetales bacterium]
MPYPWTAAAERALHAASQLPLVGGAKYVDARDLLRGLLAEEESRAAVMLAQHGVTAEVVAARWPASPNAAPAPADGQIGAALSPALGDAVARAVGRLYELPGPPATEHLLLALVLDAGEVGAWLREQGLSADALIEAVYAIYSVTPGPVDMPPDCAVASAPRGAGPSHAVPVQPDSPSSSAALLRIVDAAANRAGEGLRVVEDVVRFALDDAHLTHVCKQIRHDLASALAPLPLADRLRARETTCDVGVAVDSPDEYARRDLAQVLAANFVRVEQALRSLEETLKVALPGAVRAVEQLRYRTYTLQRVVEITRAASARLAEASLYVLLDGRDSEGQFRQLADAIVAA